MRFEFSMRSPIHKVNEMQKRAKRGSVLIVILLTAISMVLCLYFAVDLGVGITGARQSHSAIEAAALAAAQELSAVVIKDPYFGYISLSDRPPTAEHLRGADGEPCPVTSINTLIASARLQMLIALALENELMQEMARRDLAQARRAAGELEKHLGEALSKNCKNKYQDSNGREIKPYAVAEAVFRRTLEGKDRADSISEKQELRLELGYCPGTGTTVTPLPEPPGQKPISARFNTTVNYQPSKNYPLGGEDFYLAAVGPQASLVGTKTFSRPDGKHISSIVRASTTRQVSSLARQDLSMALNQAACAQPAAEGQATTAGSLLVDLPAGKISNFQTLFDLIAARPDTAFPLPVLSPQQGDYPDEAAPPVLEGGTACMTARELFSVGLYDWLRTAGARIDPDSVINAVKNEKLFEAQTNGAKRFTRFDLGVDGKVYITRGSENPFNSTRVNEKQLYCFSSNAFKTGQGECTLVFTDQVHRLGPTKGGRHAGMPVPSPTVNWVDLSTYCGNVDLADRLGRGHKLGLDARGERSKLNDDGIAADGAYYERPLRGRLANCPHKSYYSGGLAVCLQLMEER